MNISNGSCEYFYDEEYDVAINEGSYNQPCLSSLNNNVDNKNHYKHDFLTTSRLWSQCLLENSENNNYNQSCEDLESDIFKCTSSDNVIDSSRYSLSRNLPFLNKPGENLFNYHLYFDKRDSIDFKCDFDIKKQFAKKYSSKIFIDSGKCSAATSDSLIHPFKHYRNELANSENNLNETSQENRYEKSTFSRRKKTSKQLWRQLKSVFSLKKIRWKKMVIDNTSTRLCRSYSAPCLVAVDPSKDVDYKSNRFSTTVVELYNLLTALCNESNDSVFHDKYQEFQDLQETKFQGCDVSCQFPVIRGRKMRKSYRNVNVDYPGLGKIKLPHQLRTPIGHLVGSDNIIHNLKFLENTVVNRPNNFKRSNSSDTRYGRKSRLENEDYSTNNNGTKKSQIPARSFSESRHRNDVIDLKMKSNPNCIPNSLELVMIEESKCLSFSDLRPIPRNWGLSRDDQILAVFEFPCRRESSEVKNVEYDESSIRIGGLVTNAIAAIKLVAETTSSTQDLVTICDMFIRCKDSNRQSTSTLLLAVDTILALVSDGLSVGSLRTKSVAPSTLAGIKTTMRLWMFIEESCRSSLIKDVSQRLAFASVIKQVKQVCGNTVPDQRSKEWLAQLKLQIFVVVAIKNNILHIWLRGVVVNETILQRFFVPSSFFQQARTSYSNSLSAVIVEIRRLSTSGGSKVYHVGKSVRPAAAAVVRPVTAQAACDSSSDNSISKSRIPRLYRKVSNRK